MKPNGVVLYEGPSVLTGEPIVCILTGLARPSSNPKTGPMLQTWILRQDRMPTEAVKDGSDSAICGQCPLRGASGFEGRRCYVNVGNAPQQVWKTWQSGGYTRWHTDDADRAYRQMRLAEGHALRLGAYGDPAAVPMVIWSRLTSGAEGWTGYTHQWRHEKFDREMLLYCMASVETDADIAELRVRYPQARYFRVRKPGEPIAAGEVQCPASKEGGMKTQCAHCQLCAGSGVRAKSVSIEAHGAQKGNW